VGRIKGRTDGGRADIKQYRELHTQADAVDAVRKGKLIHDGAIITLVWSVEQDANGAPLKGAGGRFIKKEIVGHTVMEKRAGWGADYAADYSPSSPTPFPGPQTLVKGLKGDVNIASFTFMPAKFSAAVSKALSFLNSDDTPAARLAHLRQARRLQLKPGRPVFSDIGF
jgi:hypothetical protein